MHIHMRDINFVIWYIARKWNYYKIPKLNSNINIKECEERIEFLLSIMAILLKYNSLG